MKTKATSRKRTAKKEHVLPNANTSSGSGLSGLSGRLGDMDMRTVMENVRKAESQPVIWPTFTSVSPGNHPNLNPKQQPSRAESQMPETPNRNSTLFTQSSRPLRIFLCHSAGDKPTVRDLYHRLKTDNNIDPWFDEEKLLPGQDFNLEITKAVHSSDIVLVCISRASVNKAGYVQKELKYALDAADEQPEGTIFIIPIKLEECEVPDRLRRWQWIDFFKEHSYDLLMRSLRHRAKTLGITLGTTT